MYNVLTSEMIVDLLEKCFPNHSYYSDLDSKLSEEIREMIDLLNEYPFTIGKAD